MHEATKTVPVSGRISEEDHAFLMQYALGGKVTVSEKLRHVAAFFRQYQENMQDYGECLGELRRLQERFSKEVKAFEHEAMVRSELLERMLSFSSEVTAQLITAQIPDDPKKRLETLQKFEDQLLRQALGLLESVLRMALTRESPTYHPSIMHGKLATITELVELISQTSTHRTTSKE